MLRLNPRADLMVIERCSGHGGSWGVRKDNFEWRSKIGKPVARTAKDSASAGRVGMSAGRAHILQGIEKQGVGSPSRARRIRSSLCRARSLSMAGRSASDILPVADDAGAARSCARPWWR